MYYDDKESRIMDALSVFCAEAYTKGLSDGQWTVGIKKTLANLGKEFECETCATGIEGLEGEWLYDLVWYKSENGKLTEVVLVAESEWIMDNYELIYDFEKLLLAKSKYKLFVFQSGSLKDIEEVVTLLNSHIDAFKARLSPERYLFAALDTTQKKFEFRQKMC